jgi:hypothetical protein
LIEILVALAILAMIFGAGLEVFSRGLGALGHGEHHALAGMLARGKLDEVEALGLEPGTQTGEFEDIEPPMAWRVHVDPYEGDELGAVEARYLSLLSVQVTVTWDDGVRTRSISLDTLSPVEHDGVSR